MSEPAHSQDFYPATMWTMIRRIGATDDAAARQHLLDTLIRAYLQPVRIVLFKHVRDVGRVDDLVQEFFYEFLKREVYLRADQAKGKFRQFIQALLRDFIVDEIRRVGSNKARILSESVQFKTSPDDEDAIDLSSDQIGPDEAYELMNMWQTLKRAAEKTSTFSEYKKFAPLFSGELRTDTLWRLFDLMLLEDSHKDLAARLGISEGDCRVSMYRLKKVFATNVRADIADTLPDYDTDQERDAAVSEEVRYIIGKFKHAKQIFGRTDC